MIVKGLGILLSGMLLLLSACSSHPQLPQLPKPKPKPKPTQPSTITVEIKTGGPVVITTSAAEFQVRSDGNVQGFLLKDGGKLTLDEPRVGALSDSDYAVIDGRDVHFTVDFQATQVQESISPRGIGKRLEVTARPLGPSGTDLQRVLVIEVYDSLPNVLLTAVQYKNIGTTNLRIEKTVNQRHRFSAKLIAAKAQAWDVRSYHRTSDHEAKEESVRLTRGFSQRYPLKPSVAHADKDLPVVAVWTDEVGEAIGEWEASPVGGSMPMKVAPDGRVDLQLELDTKATLMPGQTYSGPENFLCVYAGDAGEPLHLSAALLRRDSPKTASSQPPAR